MNPEIIDNINKPSHYQGANGLEAIDVVHNFVGNLFGASALFLLILFSGVGHEKKPAHG